MDLIIKAKDILGIVAPIATFALAVLVSWGIVKWLRRLGVAFKGLSESQASIVFLIVVVALFLYMYYKHIAPMF